MLDAASYSLYYSLYYFSHLLLCFCFGFLRVGNLLFVFQWKWPIIFYNFVTAISTRMHSSRMRTTLSLPYGGSLSRGYLSRGYLSRGSLSGGLCPGGLYPGGWISVQGGLPETPLPSCEQNHRHVLKTIPCRNFVAGGNNTKEIGSMKHI